jgi:hypothetical protein
MKQVFDAKVAGTVLTYKCPECKQRHQHGYGGPSDNLIRWSHCARDDFCSIQIHLMEENE